MSSTDLNSTDNNEMENQIHVLIKNVYDRTIALNYTLEADTSIEQMKLRVKDDIDGVSSIKDIRLIYCGKICDDKSTLKELTKKIIDLTCTQTFHLIIDGVELPLRPPQTQAAPARPTPLPAEIPRSPASTSAAPAPTPPSVSTSNPPAQTQSTVPDQSSSTNPIPASQPHFSGLPGAPPMSHMAASNPYMMQQQMLLMQFQMNYLRQMQFMQQQQQTGQMPQSFAGFQQPQAFQSGIPATQPAHNFPGGNPFNRGPFAVPGIPVPQGNVENAAPATPPNAAEQPGQVNQAPVAAAPAQPRRFHFDFKLFLKLVMLVAFLGQDMSRKQLAVLICACIVAYLALTGALTGIYRRFAGPAPNAAAAAANGPAGAGVPTHRTGYVPISTEGGIVKDIQYFILSFVLSLIPAWRPTRPAAVPAVHVHLAGQNE